MWIDVFAKDDRVEIKSIKKNLIDGVCCLCVAGTVEGSDAGARGGGWG